MTPEEGMAWKSPHRDAPRRSIGKVLARLFFAGMPALCFGGVGALLVHPLAGLVIGAVVFGFGMDVTSEKTKP